MFGLVLSTAAILIGIGPDKPGKAETSPTAASLQQVAPATPSSSPTAQKPDLATPSNPPAAQKPSSATPPTPPAAKKAPSPPPVPVSKPVVAPQSSGKPEGRDQPEPTELPPEENKASLPPASTPIPSLPASIMAEISAIEARHRSILVNQPMEEWNFDDPRARYQALLKQAGSNAFVEEQLRVRLAEITRQEQASRAARTVSTILSQSRRRDRIVAAIQSRLASHDAAAATSYSAVGFVEPSSNMLDGHKVYALIGPNGSTVAYLDIPPGMDVHAHFSHRVGVRGVTHYNEDLGARLITVSDLEAVGATRR